MLLDEYREYLKGRKAHSTVEQYTRGARGFIGYLAACRMDVESMHPGAIRDYVTWLRKPEPGVNTAKPATILLIVACVKSYLKFLTGCGVRVPTMVDADTPRINRDMPVVMTTEELGIYSRLALSAEEPYGTACLLLPYCGLRISELTNLRLGDVRRHDYSPEDRRYVLFVRNGKGGKHRLAPLFTGPQMAVSSALYHYLQVKRPTYRHDLGTTKVDRFLFPSFRRQTVTSIWRKTIEDYLAGWREMTGVPDLHPHMCRATYATAMLSVASRYDPPIDVLEVARYLGHRREVETLQEHYAGVRFKNGEDFFGVIHRPDQDEYRPERRRHKQTESAADDADDACNDQT